MVVIVLLISVASAIYEPEQINLSFTENENELKVGWVVWKQLSSFVKYRAVSCNNTETTETYRYTNGTYKEFIPGDHQLWSYFINIAVLKDISRHCRYEYSIVNGEAESPLIEFNGRTQESEEPFEDSVNGVKAWIFGDLGIGENAKNTTRFLTKRGVESDGIFHLGDIAYNLNSAEGCVGDIFMRQIQPFASKVPYMVVLGNHDLHHNKSHFINRFHMPHNADNQGTGLFYSLNLGPVHFICMNSVIDFYWPAEEELNTQLNWLKKDLDIADSRRDEIPWIVIMGHVPMYCTPDWTDEDVYKEYNECFGQAEYVRSHIEDILNVYNVDMSFAGHLHNYERDSAIYKNVSYVGDFDDLHTIRNPQATVHFIVGTGGNKLGKNDPISKTFANYTMFMSDQFGVGNLQVFNATHAYWEQYRVDTEEVIDYVWIIKDK